MRETNSPQVLSCNRFRNNEIELRKHQEYKNIKKQKYRNTKIDKNTENTILTSNKDIVEKTETWKTLEELYSL